MHEKFVPVNATGRRNRGFPSSGRNDYAYAGPRQIDGDHADKKRECCDDFEVQQALPADPSNFADVAVAGDAGDECAKNQRRDNDFDEPQKNVTEEAQMRREVRRVEPDLQAGQHGDEDPVGEGTVARTPQQQQNETGPAEHREQRLSRENGEKPSAQGEKKQSYDQRNARAL